MNLIIDERKVLHFGVKGVTGGEELLTRQSEKLVISFDAEVAADEGSVQVALKKSLDDDDETILAECTSFTYAAGKFTGWLDLNTEAAIDAAGFEVYLEVSWQTDGHDQANDHAKVKLLKRAVTGTESSPSAGLTWFQRVAQVLGSWFTADSEAQTLTPVVATDEQAEAGESDAVLMTPHSTALAIAALGAAGSAPVYSAGFLTFTAADGFEYQVPATRVL